MISIYNENRTKMIKTQEIEENKKEKDLNLILKGELNKNENDYFRTE